MIVCVVGLGAIAPLHIQAAKKAGVVIGGVCDIDTAKANTLKGNYGLDCPVFADYTDMLDTVKPNAVHICTPHYLHADMCIEALRRNIHVLCEKPLCISIEEYYKIKETLASAQAQLGVCYQNRYLSGNVLAHNFVKGKSLKGIMANVFWSRDKGYYESGSWRGRMATEGGGVLINQAIHTIDLMIWLGGLPCEIEAHVSNRHLKGVIDVEDTAEIYYSIGGVPVQLFATTAAAVNYPVNIKVELEGHTLQMSGEQCFLDKKEMSELDTAVSGKGYWGGGHEMLIKDFYDCISEGRQFAIGIEEAVKSLKVVLAAYRSDGNPVVL